MIVTNKIAELIVKFAGFCNKPYFVDAVTIWPFIFIWPENLASDKGLVKHESQHLKQWLRYFIIGFPFVYYYQILKYGYFNAPLEVEARLAAVKKVK